MANTKKIGESFVTQGVAEYMHVLNNVRTENPLAVAGLSIAAAKVVDNPGLNASRMGREREHDIKTALHEATDKLGHRLQHKKEVGGFIMDLAGGFDVKSASALAILWGSESIDHIDTETFGNGIVEQYKAQPGIIHQGYALGDLAATRVIAGEAAADELLDVMETRLDNRKGIKAHFRKEVQRNIDLAQGKVIGKPSEPTIMGPEIAFKSLAHLRIVEAPVVEITPRTGIVFPQPTNS